MSYNATLEENYKIDIKNIILKGKQNNPFEHYNFIRNQYSAYVADNVCEQLYGDRTTFIKN